MRRVGGVEMLNGQAPLLLWWLRIERNISAAEIPLYAEKEGPQLLSPKYQCWEELSV